MREGDVYIHMSQPFTGTFTDEHRVTAYCIYLDDSAESRELAAYIKQSPAALAEQLTEGAKAFLSK